MLYILIVTVILSFVIIFWSYNLYLSSSDLEKTIKNIKDIEKTINTKDEKINMLQHYFYFRLVVAIIKTHNEYVCLFNEKTEEDKEESEKIIQLYAVISDFLKIANERKNKKIPFLSNEF
ncbi:8765_t:CDS:2 [Scutellospora calospora]|uniref:8765_t:CDS:1 n=1 Tax=Scutellospora calospora TaxID=85575 RepID=A0ACA9JYJ1_9GLOM|nr:8765_t:CDS:2 [Scutellospora calospora]